VPFLLKKDAEGHAAKIGGRLGSFDDAVAAVGGA
jgi:NitT/TauT family transport system substrate-binding protein